MPKDTAKKSSTAKKSKPKSRRPVVLVMEAAGGQATNAVMRSGALPFRVNPRDLDAVDDAVKGQWDALLLTGGGDLDPRLYGEKPAREVYGVSERRDYGDWTVLDEATRRGVPVMGICRGMQLIAVHNGGALRQHVDGHRGGKHPVAIEDGSAFGVVVGDHGRNAFPSLHHQIVRRHGRGMKVGARSAEGYIEAIESRDRRVIAVQFHPEYDYATNEASRRLFDWLAQAAAQTAGLPKPKRMRVKVAKPKPSAAPRSVPSTWYRDIPTPAERASANAAAARRREQQQRRRAGVTSKWVCRENCRMVFDREQDRNDHEYWLCGDPARRVQEPPPGHPDWITGAARATVDRIAGKRS